MAENQQTFVLVGQFKDGITPSLRKLNTQITSLTRTFSKFSGTLRPISKELGVMAMAAERLAATQKNSRSAFEGNVRVLKEYKRTLGQVTSAQDALNRRTPKTLNMPRQPGTPQMPRGGGGGGLPSAAAMVAGERAGDKGVGFWGMTAAMATANLAVQGATMAFQKFTGSIGGFIESGKRAQQSVTSMAGTLMTLGKVGDYAKSQIMAENMMEKLGKVAAQLPGSTEDYLTILEQTLDDQIQAFGSVEAVQKNLAGFDPKTGKKLAGGMEQSFTALFGMSAQIAGLRPQIAAMDLNQLRQSPENIRNVQLLTRNPTLAKFYMEELKKSGGDFIMALNNAMQKAIPKEQIEALKNNFDSQYQSFITTFTDAFSGVISPMRKVKIKVFQSAYGYQEEMISTMDILGNAMRQINEIVSLIMGMNLIDPMKLLNEALFEVLVWIHMFRMDLEDLKKAGDLNLGTLAETVGESIGMAIANFSNWLLNLDYERFFQTIDKLVYSFFKGLFKGFLAAFQGKAADEKGPLGGLGTSVTGTIVTLLALGKAVQVLTGIYLGASAALGAIQFSALAATIAGWAPVIVGAAQAIAAGVATFATTMALPLAAIVGAILGTVAILRHGDYILSSLWEAMKMVGNGFMWLYHGIQEFQAMLMSGLMKFLSGLPGVGKFFKGAADHFEQERLKQQQHRLDREKAMAANAAKIGQNTADSWKRTQEDAAKLRNAFNGTTAAVKGTQQALKTAAKPAQAAKPRTKADTIGGGGQGGGRGSRVTPSAPKPPKPPIPPQAPKPPKTPSPGNYVVNGIEYNWKTGMPVAKPAAAPKPLKAPAPTNYVVNGIEYNWKTGMPVKKPAPAPKPAAAPKPRLSTAQPARAARPVAPAPKPAAPAPRLAAPKPVAAPKPPAPPAPPKPVGPPPPANLSPAAVTSIQTAVTNGVKAAQVNQGQTWQQALAPIAAGITTLGTYLVSGFNAARVLAAGAKAEAKVSAANQAKLLNSVIISTSGTKQAVMAVSSKVATQPTQVQVASNTAKALTLLAQINTSVKSSGMMGMMPGGFSPPLGGAQGSLGNAARMASASGLQVTSSFRPGDKGYHGVGRAMDFSNSTGPTPQMMAFAQQMIAKYGSSLTELIYSPLGFSIKHGRKVPPLAYGAHFNHVHVAFGQGPGNPTMFSNANAAMAYERMMAPAGAKIATVTANSSEFGGGGHTTVNQNISINGAQDPQRLAELVFDYASRAAQRVNNASFA
jgi:hypothetical protein